MSDNVKTGNEWNILTQPNWNALFARETEFKCEPGVESLDNLLKLMTPAHSHLDLWSDVHPTGREIW